MSSLPRLSRENLSEQVYSTIRENLIDGKYEPGERLRISVLAEELGVSVTPVREAIFRLAADHVLEVKAATAVHVRAIAPDELREIQLMRHLLEGEAAAVAAKRINPAELNDLRELQEKFRVAAGRDPYEAAYLNRQFHFGLVAASRLHLVYATVENLWTLMGPLLRTFHMTVPKRDLTSRNHKHYDVLRALETGDGAAAKAAIQADIKWGNLLVEWLENQHKTAATLSLDGA